MGTGSNRRHVSLPTDDLARLERLMTHFGRRTSWVVQRALRALEAEVDTGAGSSDEVMAACQTLREAGHPGYRMLADVERVASGKEIR